MDFKTSCFWEHCHLPHPLGKSVIFTSEDLISLLITNSACMTKWYWTIPSKKLLSLPYADVCTKYCLGASFFMRLESDFIKSVTLRPFTLAQVCHLVDSIHFKRSQAGKKKKQKNNHACFHLKQTKNIRWSYSWWCIYIVFIMQRRELRGRNLKAPRTTTKVFSHHSAKSKSTVLFMLWVWDSMHPGPATATKWGLFAELNSNSIRYFIILNICIWWNYSMQCRCWSTSQMKSYTISTLVF